MRLIDIITLANMGRAAIWLVLVTAGALALGYISATVWDAPTAVWLIAGAVMGWFGVDLATWLVP